MKRAVAFLALTCALAAFSQTNVAAFAWTNAVIAPNAVNWGYGRPGMQVVTNAPSREEFRTLSNTVANLTSGTSISNYVKAVMISTNRYELYLVTP